MDFQVSVSLSHETAKRYCDGTFMRMLMVLIILFRRFLQNCGKRLWASSCLSGYPSVCPCGKNSAPIGRIFM